MVVAFGRHAVDLYTASRVGVLDTGLDPELFVAASLNPLLAAGRPAWQAVRGGLRRVLARPDALPPGVLVPRDELTMALPVEVGDYVDGYGGIHHATNMGEMVRPGSDPLAPNWRRMPVAYHGRSSTVVPSGTPVVRPAGQMLLDGRPGFAPTAMLDVELELGFVVGRGSPRPEPIDIAEAGEHVFGVVLLNDWSARDIQLFESQPLGPFLGKSFATSISVWVVTLDALAPYLVGGLAAAQEPEPAAYLRTAEPWIPDLQLEVALQSATMKEAGLDPAVVAHVRFAEAMYWSMAQQLAHATVNGATVRPGDLFGSGTASGPDAATQGGSLLELTWGGSRPLELPTGERRAFLEDGDMVVMRGHCGDPAGSEGIRLGEVVGTVVAARPSVQRGDAR